MDNGEDWQKPNIFGRRRSSRWRAAARRLEDERWRGAGAHREAVRVRRRRRPRRVPAREHARAGPRCGEAGHELFGAIRDLPYPTLAAVNGAALGGGLEIALHCDFRTLARSVRHLGFPEVFLGIVPAWGGTQLMPRLVGAAARRRAHRRQPAQAEPSARARPRRPSSASPTRSSTTWSSSTSRSRGSSARSRRTRAARRPTSSDAAEVCAKARYAVDDAVHGVALAPVPRPRADRGRRELDARGGLPRPRRMRSPSCFRARRRRRRLRLRPRRAADQARRRHSRRGAAADRGGSASSARG